MALLLLPVWAAAAIDVRTRRIPNALTGPALLAALGVAAWEGALPAAILGAAACLAVGSAIAFAARGGFGGGDVKLMTCAGAIVGITTVPGFLFWMSIAGGLLAGGIVLLCRHRGVTMPYGPAIAAGCTVAWWTSTAL
jgi:Flp pilus assembly protein protease CpaA